MAVFDFIVQIIALVGAVVGIPVLTYAFPVKTGFTIMPFLYLGCFLIFWCTQAVIEKKDAILSYTGEKFKVLMSIFAFMVSGFFMLNMIFSGFNTFFYNICGVETVETNAVVQEVVITSDYKYIIVEYSAEGAEKPIRATIDVHGNVSYIKGDTVKIKYPVEDVTKAYTGADTSEVPLGFCGSKATNPPIVQGG